MKKNNSFGIFSQYPPRNPDRTLPKKYDKYHTPTIEETIFTGANGENREGANGEGPRISRMARMGNEGGRGLFFWGVAGMGLEV